jgi:hypothetical protein
MIELNSLTPHGTTQDQPPALETERVARESERANRAEAALEALRLGHEALQGRFDALIADTAYARDEAVDLIANHAHELANAQTLASDAAAREASLLAQLLECMNDAAAARLQVRQTGPHQRPGG